MSAGVPHHPRRLEESPAQGPHDDVQRSSHQPSDAAERAWEGGIFSDEGADELACRQRLRGNNSERVPSRNAGQ